MSYLIKRLHQLLDHYQELPESVQADSLAMIQALKSTGESISLLEYKSEKLQLATVTVENLVSFTEKTAQETALGVANQLAQFIQSIIRLSDDFQTVYSKKKSDIDIVKSLKQSNDDLIFIYEAPYSVTIEIKKVVSFTAKSTSKCADCLEDAANEMVCFLKQLAKME